MKKILLIVFGISLMVISNNYAKTIQSINDGRWSQTNIWDSNTVPGKNDDVIISQADTVFLDYALTNYLAVCHSLTVEGTLVLGEEYYGDPITNLYIYGTLAIRANGTVRPALDTTNIHNSYHSIIIGGDFSNHGSFIPSMSNSKHTVYTYISMNGYGSIDAYHQTDIYSLSIYDYTTLTGKLHCQSLELYSTLNNTNGQLKINDNGNVLMDSSASFAFIPRYGKNISFQLGKFIDSTTALPDSVYQLDFYGSLALDKSITITHRINFQSYDKSFIYTGNDTLFVAENAEMWFNYLGYQYVVGNLARVFSSNDSLKFYTGTKNLIRPVTIKLNNLNNSKDTVTVAAESGPVNIAAMPQNIGAVEKTHYWKIGASKNYKNVDADVYLEFNEKTALGNFYDYISNRNTITVVRGNQKNGEWTYAAANPVIGNFPIITVNVVKLVGVKSIKSFGDFTTAQFFTLPNGNFEDWEYGLPYGWMTNNGAYTSPITQSSNSHSGSYAVKGRVTNYNGTITQPILKFSMPTMKIPQSLSGYYKLNSISGDQFDVNVTVYKDTLPVAKGNFTSTVSDTSFQNFSISIDSVNEKLPTYADSLLIEVTMKPGNNNLFHVGSYFTVDDFSFDKVTQVASEKNTVPLKFNLYQNYPNPFNPSTTIQYDLPAASIVKLDVFNILGQQVETLVNNYQNAGTHTISFNPQYLSSGVYIYRLTASSKNRSEITLTKKMIYEK